MVGEGSDHDALSRAFGFGMGGGDARDDGVELGLRLLEGDARLQPADRLQEDHAPVFASCAGHRGRERQPQVDAAGELEGGRHHADDRVAVSREGDGLADHLRIAIEALTPDPVAEDHDPRGAHLIVALFQRSPQRRPHAQHGEEAAGDLRAFEQRGLASARHHVAVAVGGRGHGGQAREALALGFPVLELGQRQLHERALRDGVPLPGDDQSFLGGERQGAEDHRLDDAEDRGGGADAQGQGEHGHHAEAGVLREDPQAVAKVLREILQLGLQAKSSAREWVTPGTLVGDRAAALASEA